MAFNVLRIAMYGVFCTRIAASDITKMRDIINANFAGINEGSVLSVDGGPPFVANPLQFCAKLNYADLKDVTHIGSIRALFSDHAIRELKNITGLQSLCDTSPDDATCRAVDAVILSYLELEAAFPSGPAFANYLPVWTDTSMKAVACADGAFDVSSKTWTNRNGCNGWAICDTLLTVLTTSASQAYTGTCGLVAVLTAMSKVNPAYALRLAVELMWTGKISKFDKPVSLRGTFQPASCDYIYEHHPGIHPVGTGNVSHCGPNPTNDCLVYQHLAASMFRNSSVALPATPGLTWAWSQYTGTWNYNRVAGKNDCSQHVFGELAPDFTNYTNLSMAWGTLPSGVLALCDQLINQTEQSCVYLFNDGIRQALTPNMSTADFEQYVLFEGLTGFDFPYLDDDNVPPSADTPPNVKKWMNGVVSSGGDLKGLLDAFSTPSATMENLLKACESVKPKHGAIIALDADLLTDSAFANKTDRQCNHAVYLDRCDMETQEVWIWTWASYRTNLHFSDLVFSGNISELGKSGAVCGFVVVQHHDPLISHSSRAGSYIFALFIAASMLWRLVGLTSR